MTNIHPPHIATHREEDGTWTVTLWVQGVWHAQLHGFASAAAARAAIRRRYL